jgi:asparagine synthase (glutamine-hydrolysing)
MPELDCAFHVKLGPGVPVWRGTPRFFRGHRVWRGPGLAPDGIFASWQWDGRTVTVTNDRYGMSPLFYWHDREQFGVSPSVLALVAQGAPTRFDQAAIDTFLRLGFFLGSDTAFEAIRAVPPNTVLEWSGGVLRISGGPPKVKRQSLGRDDAIDGFVALCRQAVQRRPPDPDATIVPLSSGRDSRHILFELCAAGHRPRSVTIPRYPPRPAEDERIAPIVAKAAGVPHTLLVQPGSRFPAELHKNWATHLCADEHAWFVAMIASLEEGTSVLYDGLGGALSVPNRFHSRQALELLGRGRTRQVADRIVAEFGVNTEAYLAHVVNPSSRAGARERAVARIAAELDEHLDAPDPIKSFNFWNRIRRELALVPYGLMKRISTVYTPYLDHDLYDLLMGLPADILTPDLKTWNKGFHTEAVARAFPQYADLPYENKGAPKLDRRAHDGRFGTAAGAFIVGNLPREPQLVCRSYVLPRALCAAAAHAFGRRHPWFAGPCLYLTQLEMAAQRRLPTSIELPPPVERAA